MAVTRVGNIIAMSAVGDTVVGKFRVRKVVFWCGTGNHQVTLEDGVGFEWLNQRGFINRTNVSDFPKGLPIETIKVTALGTAPRVTIHIE